MNNVAHSFDYLIKEACREPFSGWDFVAIESRMKEGIPSWDYRKIVQELLQSAYSLLEMGAGGGEFLSTFNPLPPITYATECYTPNIPLAESRLKPLGVDIVSFSSDDNLPFEDNFFELIINRHTRFDTDEVFRILAPDGQFVTEQIGNCHLHEINAHLAGEPLPNQSRQPKKIRKFLQESGMEILEFEESHPLTIFSDIGAIVYFLNANPWQLPGFSVQKYNEPLLKLHKLIEKEGEFSAHSHYYYIKARRPMMRKQPSNH